MERCCISVRPNRATLDFGTSPLAVKGSPLILGRFASLTTANGSLRWSQMPRFELEIAPQVLACELSRSRALIVLYKQSQSPRMVQCSSARPHRGLSVFDPVSGRELRSIEATSA